MTGHAVRPDRLHDERHNEANGEDNRDGHQPQPELELRRGGRHGGPGGARAARAADAQHARDAVPGARRANAAGWRRVRRHAGWQNNADRQDNETSWSTGSSHDAQQAQLRFVADLLALRAARPNCAGRPSERRFAARVRSRRPLRPIGGWTDDAEGSTRRCGASGRSCAGSRNDDAPESAQPPGCSSCCAPLHRIPGSPCPAAAWRLAETPDYRPGASRR